MIRLQVSWRYLQPLAPAGRSESWKQLEPRPRRRRPAAARPPDRGREPRRGARDPLPLPLLSRVVERHLPGATGAGDGQARGREAPARPVAGRPLVWFVEYLCDRYGGPSRPHIWGLEISNEPNLLCWPQLGVADAVAAMATTAARAVAGRPYPALLMLPGDIRLPGRGRGRAGHARSPPGGRASRPRCWSACAAWTPAARRCPRGRITTTVTPRWPTAAAIVRGSRSAC